MEKLKPDIENVFSVGYRCNTDDFLNYASVRNCSGPFSYMVSDLETSLNFIETNFEDFTNVNLIKASEHSFTWNGRKWKHDLFFNNKFLPESHDKAVDKIDRMCCWNHHNLHDKKTIETIQRRQDRLLTSINKKNTLLIYIEKLQKHDFKKSDKKYIHQNKILKFLSDKKNTHMCVLLPFAEFEITPILENINPQLNMIFYRSSNDMHINDVQDKKINWLEIKNIFLKLYSFKNLIKY